ncbi:hypothetical protein ACIGBJ_24570, partial [Stutzerimonas stutzeri]|uniref:hypothetical protein n=1 Tax=Stutzerimonas stutzeri TaxID=316 RepID=UPI0037D19DAE
NLKWLAATSTAGTSDRLAAAKPTFSTESARSGHEHLQNHAIQTSNSMVNSCSLGLALIADAR